MTSSLRMRVVEAGARAFFSDEWNDFDSLAPGAQDALRDDAEVALDAMLNYLTDNADEWGSEAGNRYMTDAARDAETDEEATILNLVAVLRDRNE